MKKTFGVLFGTALLATVIGPGNVSAGPIPGLALCPVDVVAANCKAFGEARRSVSRGGNIGSRHVVLADATPLGDIVGGRISAAVSKDKPTSEPKDKERYKSSGYPTPKSHRDRVNKAYDSVPDHTPEPKKPEASRPEKDPRSGDRDGGGRSSGGSSSGGSGRSEGARDFSKGHGGDQR